MRIVGLGIDLVEVGRIEQMLKAHGERFVDRVFTEAERGYAEEATRRRAERYAARFACKEAVLKALGSGWGGGVSWREIEVVRGVRGEPTVRLSGRCAELARRRGIVQWHTSLSHVASHAVASVVGCGGDSSDAARAADRT
jgi:holo-[acyl-carrier protein] synthase